MNDPRDQPYPNVPPPPLAPRPLPPAGWFPDPSGRHDHRYWDGHAWTDYVADHGVQSVAPVAQAAPVVTTPAPAPMFGVAPPPSVPTASTTASGWTSPSATGLSGGRVRSLGG